MASFNSLFDLETLFIEKLQEKYKLNIRDVKRAFSQFDLDNNGLLDLAELTQGVQMFLNGVKESQVRELVQQYDLNGDGKISYEEFLHFLQNRTAISADDNYDDERDARSAGRRSANSRQINKKSAAAPRLQRMADDDYRDLYGEEVAEESEDYYDDRGSQRSSQPSSARSHQYEYHQNTLRAPQRGGAERRRVMSAPQRDRRYEEEEEARSDMMRSEVRSALDSSNPRELEYRAKVFIQRLRHYLVQRAHDLRFKGKVKMPVTMKLEELQEKVARDLLMKLFQPFTGANDGRARGREEGVEFPDFSRVLRSFSFPGTSPIRPETIHFLFDLCSHTSAGPVLNEEGRPVADAHHFIDLIFGQHLTRREEVQRQRHAIRLDKTDVTDAEGLPLTSFVDKMEAGRRKVGTGPVRVTNPTDAKAEKAQDILAVPLRFVSRKSRTALTVPSDFDPTTAIPRSDSLPSHHLVRKHVFGLSTTHYSGNTLHVLPYIPDAFQDLRNRRGALSSQHPTTPRSNPDFIDNAVVLYTSAALGVVHNLSTNSQIFFDRHTDDVTCVALSSDGSLAATGCVGKAAVIHIWRTNISSDPAQDLIRTIGPGPFDRGVCAVEFSWDNRYIVGIGCDDTHTMTIFEVSSGNKVIDVSCTHGIPPQIRWLTYCPGQQHTEYVTREHAGLCDLFATAGDHHIRIWSFRRPVRGSAGGGVGEVAALAYKGCTMGKLGVSPAKVFTCCVFVYCEDKTYDFVAGGSNGVVYLWRRGVPTLFSQVFRGRIQVMVLGNDRLYVGGVGGQLKVLDARTLAAVRAFNLLGVSATLSNKNNNRPGSASAGRPRSASATPSSRRPGTAGVVTAVKSKAPPSHAAGLSTRARDSSDVDNTASEELDSGARLVTGIAIVGGMGRHSSQGSYLIVSLGTGKVVRVDLTSAAAAGTEVTSLRNAPSSAGGAVSDYRGSDLFFFHTGPVYGLAADVSSSQRLFATVGDDKKLMVWDSKDRVVIGKATLKNPSRCCHLDKTNSFLAVGSNAGSLTIYFLTDFMEKGGNYYRIDEVAYRKDGKSEVTEVKFSPSNDKIALGAHDDCIYLYSCDLSLNTSGEGRKMTTSGSCVLRALHRLRGHSSTITHIDWSYDSKLLRSTCQAYELLCWDVDTGRLNTAVNAADVKWRTHHCVLGFHVMGIWPPYSDGTDINSIDVSAEKGLVVTGNDDAGLVRLFNYPCIVKNAPAKEYGGHSSHVTNVKFLRGGDTVVTSGGNDGAAMIFDVLPDEVDEAGFR